MTYEIAMPFERDSAKINLIREDDGKVEVLISDFPVPTGYHTGTNYPSLLDGDDEKNKQFHTARWVLQQAGRELDEYDWETSNSSSRKPNYYLRDVYFQCDLDGVNNAVMASKRFLSVIEDLVLFHHQENNSEPNCSPYDDLAP